MSTDSNHSSKRSRLSSPHTRMQRPDARIVLRDRPQRVAVMRLERLEPHALADERYVKRQLPPSSNARRMRRATTILCTSSGAVVDARAARHPVHRRERRVLGHAEPAVHLQRAVDHVVQHARRVELDQRDLDARLVALVDAGAPPAASSAGTPGSRRPTRRSSSGSSACPRAARRTPCARARTSTSARTRAASGRASA